MAGLLLKGVNDLKSSHDLEIMLDNYAVHIKDNFKDLEPRTVRMNSWIE